jgi:hypothetical protein
LGNLFDYLASQDLFVIDKWGDRVNMENISASQYSFSGYIVSKENKYQKSNISRDGRRIIDNGFSAELIELSTNRKVDSKIKENCFEFGRIYYSTAYYDKNDNLVHKPKYLDDMYSVIKKWFKKNCRMSNHDKYYHIGADAYAKYLSGQYIPCNGIFEIPFTDGVMIKKIDGSKIVYRRTE